MSLTYVSLIMLFGQTDPEIMLLEKPQPTEFYNKTKEINQYKRKHNRSINRFMRR
jgi:hypothetical protein